MQIKSSKLVNNNTGDFMKNKLNLYTDLIEEGNHKFKKSIRNKYKDIEIISSKYNNYDYTTIYFNDISNSNSYLLLEKVLVKELKKYIKISSNYNILVVGLGNEESTPDSLGPKTIDNILVTRHLKILNVLNDNYASVSIFKPSVIGDTGLESIKLIKSISKDIKATKVIVIDALKASKINRLLKTIQITNSGMHPGSGINNDRGELSKKTLNIEVIAIGVPTVVDIKTIINNLIKEDIYLDTNLILTPTDINYQINILSKLLGESINKSLHKRLYPTK